MLADTGQPLLPAQSGKPPQRQEDALPVCQRYYAYATGISQDIQDYLDNPVAYALLSNSEFVIMLRQSKSLEALERLYGLSKPQLEFLRNASEGHGIIKMGNSMIPFSNLEPKDTAVYKLITTKPGEATAEK